MDEDFLSTINKVRYLDGYFLNLPNLDSSGSNWQRFLTLLLDDLNT